MSDTEAWYIVKQENGQCKIAPASDVNLKQPTDASATLEHWGPYDSQQDAIARRVGLIRAGKCQPV